MTTNVDTGGEERRRAAMAPRESRGVHVVACVIEECTASTVVNTPGLARSLRMSWRCRSHYGGRSDVDEWRD